jgi:excisionase family DNA binding protein
MVVTNRRCLTPDEYATERRISLRTVYRHLANRSLKAERVGRQWRIWIVTVAKPVQNESSR